MPLLMTGLHDEEHAVIGALSAAAAHAPQASVAVTLRTLLEGAAAAGLPDASDGVLWCRLGEQYDYSTNPDPAKDTFPNPDAIAYLLQCIWAAQDIVTRKTFRLFVAEVLTRLPDGETSNMAVWQMTVEWLSEVQPDFEKAHRAAFSDWLEDILTSSSRYADQMDVDPNEVIAQIRSGQQILGTGQIREMIKRFTFEWVEEQGHFNYLVLTAYLMVRMLLPARDTPVL